MALFEEGIECLEQDRQDWNIENTMERAADDDIRQIRSTS